MITFLINSAVWCSKHKLHIASSLLLFIVSLTAKGQAQKTNYVFTATSPTTFGWKAMESGWGVNKVATDSGFIYQTDTSQVMTVSRASDSITNMKATIATKMATAAFTGAAIITALGFTPYNSTNPDNYITNSSLSGYVQSTRSISTTSPLIGGGDLSANRTFSIADAAADGSTKGAASFTAADFNSSNGNISIDYTNGQAASGSNKGFLTSADWTTFNNKGSGTVSSIATTSPITGGTITNTGTIGINNSAADNATKGAASFDSAYFNDNGSGLISFGLNYGTGTISASAVTINAPRGKITYNSPNLVAAGTASLTFTNSYINSTSTINVGINGNGSNLISINCYIKSQTSGSCVINIQNLSLLNLFNSNMVIDFMVVN